MIQFRVVAMVETLGFNLLATKQVVAAVDKVLKVMDMVLVLVEQGEQVIYLEQQEELLLIHLLLSGVYTEKVVKVLGIRIIALEMIVDVMWDILLLSLIHI